MADAELPVEAGGGGDRPDTWLTRLTGFVAVFGGLLALAVAILVTTSVLGRWLFNAPIDGDFEFVKMATAVAVFAYLPYTQARRGNIMVDTFTGGLSSRTQLRIDAFWDLVYAVAMAALAIALFVGTKDSIRSGETTMQRQILLWPSIGLAMVLCALLAFTALMTSMQRLKSSRAGDPS
jgi:TRAP-type mannitol/chloroaromatic compound transport system permease small subunit